MVARRTLVLRVQEWTVDSLGDWLVFHPPYAEPAHLDPAGKRGSRSNQQSAVRFMNMNAIVTDQKGKWQRAAPGSLQQRQRQARFAGTGRALNENGARADQNR